MNSEFQIAMVNDDRNIQSSLRFALEAEGYVVRTYLDAALGFEGLINEPADLGIFSRDMPYMHGPDLLRRLRQSSNMPAMLLTSFEADDIYRMYGDEVLFDDIITMPFSMHLVVSRVGTILRRGGVGDENSMSTILERGLLQLDTKRHSCSWDGKPVPLAVTELLILAALAIRPGVVKSRDALMDAAYDDGMYVDDRTIDRHVRRIRKKLKAVDEDCAVIETLYGVGYRFKDG